MRAFTRDEAWQLALEDADRAARNTRGLKGYYRKADRIKRRRGWKPWWAIPSTECVKCGADDWREFFDTDRGTWRRACRECRRQRERRGATL